jgi:lysophospholipase L1-like esterase
MNSRRAFLAALVGLLTLGGLAGPAAAAEASEEHWVGAWSTGQQPPHIGLDLGAASGISEAGFDNQTLRMLVYPTLSGDLLRVRLGNTFGAQPLTISAASVAWQSEGAALMPGSARPITFGGSASVSVPVGAEIYSDPVDMRIEAGRELAISLYVAGRTGPTSWHRTAWQTAYVAAGDHTADEAADAYSASPATSWFWLDGVDVTAPSDAYAVVTLGDSITEGTNSTVNANARWPDVLARRLMSEPDRRVAVLNEGIGGNRVRNDSPCFGTNALARLNRDVFGQDGVRYVILMEGTNDIGFSNYTEQTVPANRPLACYQPNAEVPLEAMIAGYEQAIEQAHLKGLKIIGATLTPFKGSIHFSEGSDLKRQAINDWIRQGQQLDGVIDFDAAVRDPEDAQRIASAFDSGDHLHPNDAGYQAMADAIDLSLLAP